MDNKISYGSKEYFKQEIDKIVADIKYDWDYQGRFDKSTSEGFSDRLADKLVEIQGRFSNGFIPYVSIGPGWYRIIADIDSRLSYFVPDYTISQIKEKFGTLRYYCDLPSDDTLYDLCSALVSYGELLSQFTCEECGGMARTECVKGWYSTICEECREKKSNVK